MTIDAYTPRRVEPGEPPSASEVNDFRSHVITSISGDGSTILVSRRGNSATIRAVRQQQTAAFWFKITADNGSGRYSITQQTAQQDGSLANATDPITSDHAFPINGASTLPVGTFVRARAGVLDGSGNQTYLFGPVAGSASNPATLGASGETETADTGTWDRGDQGADDGLTMTCLTRLAYNDAGDETLYAYYRDFKYDSLGHLYEVTAETRTTIDTPEAC